MVMMCLSIIGLKVRRRVPEIAAIADDRHVGRRPKMMVMMLVMAMVFVVILSVMWVWLWLWGVVLSTRTAIDIVVVASHWGARFFLRL